MDTRPPVLNPYAIELSRVSDSSEEDTAAYMLLVKSIEAEPYLLTQMVAVANSVAHGIAGTYFYSAEDCVRRIGLSDTHNIVLTFYVKQAMDSIVGRSPIALQLWTESVSSARLARLATRFLSSEVLAAQVYLATLLSYLGELFIVSHTAREKLRPLTVFGASMEPSVDGEVNPYWTTLLLMDRLEVPSPIRQMVRGLSALPVLDADAPAPQLPMGTAAAILARQIIREKLKPSEVYSAQLHPALVEIAIEELKLAPSDIETLSKAGVRLLEQPWAV